MSALVAELLELDENRDDRVVRSLGLEPRPPYPKGYVLPHSDWSLLDPVCARPPFWRRT